MKKVLLITGLVILLSLAVTWLWPLPPSLNVGGPVSTTRILDRSGKLLYELRRGGLQHDVTLASMQDVLVHGLVAVEDRTFYSHPGVSMRGITRAFLRNVEAGGIVEGGSTITQQYVRTARGTVGRSFLTKISEAWLALKVDAWASKDDIIERYLNTAYFGHQAYGIAAAAKTYFGKSPAELSVGECALLIGLINAPHTLDPFENLPGALKRRELVLSLLRDQGVISPGQYDDARREPVRLASDRIDIRAPHFVMWLLNNRPEAFQRDEVRTTLDLGLQSEAEQIVETKLAGLSDKNVTSAAVVVLDARSGDILAMVGSADYFDAALDGAVNVAVSPRQPGSALKPFTYALAFGQGMTAASTIADVQVQYRTQAGDPYLPRNYDYDEHGLVRLREALANSYNIAAVRVLEQVGVGSLLTILRQAGISTLNNTPEYYGLALTLGDGEVTLLELSQAFGMFAREGKTLVPRSMADDPVAPGSQILDPRVTWLIADILSDPGARLPQFGDSGPLNFDVPVAAKTGTTRNSRDNWTVGFTADRIVGVWVGNADNSPMRGTSGVTGAGPIFHDVMLAAIRGFPPSPIPRLDGIVERTICRLSGKLPTDLCTDRLTEKFIAGTEPTQPDDIYRKIAIDRRNGLLADARCPADVTEWKVLTVFPLELKSWARERGFPVPPSDVSPLCGGGEPAVINHDEPETLEITLPRPGASFRLDPLIPVAGQKITLSARATDDVKTVQWSVDGRTVCTARSPDFRCLWQPVVGSHTIFAIGGGKEARVTMEVIR